MAARCLSLGTLPNAVAKEGAVAHSSHATPRSSSQSSVRFPASEEFGGLTSRCSLLGGGDWRQPAFRKSVGRSRPIRRIGAGRVVAEVIKDDGVKWWEKEGPSNFKEIGSTQELIDALANAGDRLVIVEFFGAWCGSCKALYPKLCKIAESRPDIDFYKINFDLNKPLCKRLNIRVLPYFHFYRGADGRLDAFSASISKIQRLKDAIEIHGTERCSLGPPAGVGDLDLVGSANVNPPTANAM